MYNIAYNNNWSKLMFLWTLMIKSCCFEFKYCYTQWMLSAKDIFFKNKWYSKWVCIWYNPVMVVLSLEVYVSCKMWLMVCGRHWNFHVSWFLQGLKYEHVILFITEMRITILLKCHVVNLAVLSSISKCIVRKNKGMKSKNFSE